MKVVFVPSPTSSPSFQLPPSLYRLFPGTSMRFKPYGSYKYYLESPKVEDFAVQCSALDLLLPSQQLFATDRGGD